MSSLPDKTHESRALDDYGAVVNEPFWLRHRVLLTLAAILLVAAFFRFFGRDFDQGHNQHPDERAVVSRTMTIHWPSSLGELFDVRRSPLNLRGTTVEGNCPPDGCTYPWGSLPNYLTRGTAWLLDTVLPPAEGRPKGYYLNDYQATTLVGRNVSSIFDLITLLLVFLIARRLYSNATALIAMALVGFAVTHIQLAHFYASDTFLTTFMMGALYFSVVLMQRPAWWAAAGAGACLGLAVASKASVVPFALVIVAALALRALYRRRTRKLGAELGDPVGVKPAAAGERSLSYWGHFFRSLRYLALAGLFALLAFAITEPYVLWSFDFGRLPAGFEAFLQSNAWWRSISEQAAVQAGKDYADVPFTRQYVGTVPLLYQLQNMVLWGLSPVAGLVAVVGFAVGLWRAARRMPAEVLLMAGAIPYFATILTLESKWMRYMLPLVPVFCILGAAFLVRGALRARGRFANDELRSTNYAATRSSRLSLGVQRNLFPILTAASIGTAFLWAVAFMNIYTQPHSRVQASEWIYDNVPAGAKHSSEGWDDALPLSLPPKKKGEPPRDGSIYGELVQYNLYDDHPVEDELNYIKGLLRQTDYIFLASNRLYGSIPRLPWRYPVQIKFYELLFQEKLGFKSVHTTLVTPELMGIRFDDQSADESFTVYDHPRVDIFKKVADLTDDELRTLFSTALNRPPGSVSTSRHGKVEDDKSLAYEQRLSDLPAVGDFSWNPLAQENTQWIAVLLWLLAVEVTGFLALPVVFTVCRNLPDRGYPVAKVVGLLLVSWGVWLAASAHLVPFTAWSVLLFTGLLAGLSLLCWRLGAGREIRSFLATKRNLLLYYEAIFLVAFAFFLFIRMLDPDLWHPTLGGEKPMEFGFLNAILRSPWMPPADPFFAGGYINYYYHGQFIIGCLIKLVGVDPAIGFNLAIPLLYGLSFTAAASLIYNVVAWSRQRRGSTHAVSRAGMAFGLLSGVLMLAIGNMHGLYQEIVIHFPALGQALANWSRILIAPMHAGPGGPYVEQAFTTPYTTFNFWDASRIVATSTINEFPFWSFLFADLHPHLI
ncbi:MAG: DUF2298 domain-containing protein, partial [Chloroflexota bacterium]|nr:DUF2298 domain-containing protein [Chloroflexota bacterium]